MKRLKATLLAWLAWTGTAQAYCRTMSCELGEATRVEQSGMACQRDVSGCVTEGKPLHWTSPCIDYAVQTDGSPKLGLDADTFEKKIAEAFGAWEGVTCPGGGKPRFQARFQGYSSCDRVEHVCGGPSRNVNVIMFHDSGWTQGASVLGLTTPSGGTVSGLIVDADLELNSQDYSFDLDSASTSEFRLRDVLAHELGHFLGLDHSNMRGALMSADYQTLAMSRELLTEDDVAAICAAYPPGAELTCGAPSMPAYDACEIKPGDPAPDCQLASMTHDKQESGCSVGHAPPRRGVGLASLFVASLWVRRRRTQPASLTRSS